MHVRSGGASEEGVDMIRKYGVALAMAGAIFAFAGGVRAGDSSVIVTVNGRDWDVIPINWPDGTRSVIVSPARSEGRKATDAVGITQTPDPSESEARNAISAYVQKIHLSCEIGGSLSVIAPSGRGVAPGWTTELKCKQP
jgi:hypothetical protein